MLRGVHEQSPYYAAREALVQQKQSGVHSGMGWHVPSPLDAIDYIVQSISRHIAAGNLKVFAELGPLFASMIAAFSQERAYCSTRLEQFINAQLQPGASEGGGQAWLISAVTRFYQAMFTADPDRKAELILYANAQTGLHEQIRLQPYIENALNAPLATARQSLTFGHHEVEHPPESRPHHLFMSALDACIHPIVDRISKLWLKLATHYFMELKLPEGILHLGYDLPKSPTGPLYPPVLQQIDDEELLALLAPYKADDETTEDSGAANWADLYERMKFILELFRSRQQELSLFDQPFSYAQRIAIAKGELPGGVL